MSPDKPTGKRTPPGKRPAERGSPEALAKAEPKMTVIQPGSPSAIEAQIQARRDHLAATIDELTARAAPKAIAQRSVAGVQAKIRTVTHPPEGQLRIERLAAAGAAVVALGTALIWLRRRT